MFVKVDETYVNLDNVLFVEKHPNGHATIHFTSGKQLLIDARDAVGLLLCVGKLQSESLGK